jgi:aminoglycoside phosphotransferase (APT) family kinase protein
VIKPAVQQTGTPQQLKEVIGLTAVALTSLHRLRFDSPKVRSLQSRVKKWHRQADAVRLVAPLLAQEAATLLQQIERLGAHSTTVAPSFLHGDFGPGQLLLEKDQMAIVDFDTVSRGDPAMDVGLFMAKLHRSAVSSGAGDEFRQLATYFLSEYQARLPENRVAERIHLFLSAALVRLALREFERKPYEYGRAGADSLPVLLLREAAACLKEI